jgi:hypothetical protein
MVEVIRTQYSFAYRLLRFLANLLAGGVIAQAIGCLSAYVAMSDTQAAGMLAHIIMQHLAYYFLGCGFAILSLANILIKRGVSSLKSIRLPSLVLMLTVALANFLLIPRMDYLQETALLDGMPVMLSPLAHYFEILNFLLLFLVLAQMVSSTLVAWRLSALQSSQVDSNRSD